MRQGRWLITVEFRQEEEECRCHGAAPKQTRLIGAFPCKAPVTDFVLRTKVAQGTYQTGSESAEYWDHGHDLRHQWGRRSILMLPLAHAALVARHQQQQIRSS